MTWQPPDVKDLPPWGTREALLWGVAHPDWPFHSAETRRLYEYPTGAFWLEREAAQATKGTEA